MRIGFHSGCCTWSSGTNQDVGTPGTIWVGSSPWGHCRLGVYGVSSVSLSFGAWSTLCLTAVLPRSVAKLCERGWLCAKNEFFWMIRRDQRQKPRHGGSGTLPNRFLVAESWSRLSEDEHFFFLLFVLQSISKETSGETAEPSSYSSSSLSSSHSRKKRRVQQQ